MKIYCYAQNCRAGSGSTVSQTEIDRFFDEHPEAEKSDDWDLIATGTEEQIVADVRRMLAQTPFSAATAFNRRQWLAVLKLFRRPEIPARMIDGTVWESDGRIEPIGDEFDREDLESEQPEKVADLIGWSPFSEVWKIEETFYIASTIV